MCGIAGQFLRERNVEFQHILAMCAEIRHRGPDQAGYHVEGRCGIGMRRLSVIALADGRQPISSEDGRIQVVFNGEIYNHQELRRDLTARGHRFQTASDTEVLVHLYEEHGIEGVSKLRGMFSYAVCDGRNQSLFLARDRFGKKPLYYAALPGGLYFASELKCLRVAGVPLELDREALQLYFLLNYIPDPWSPYRAIRKLPAGGWLRCQADGRIEQGRYWSPPVPAESAGEAMDWAATRARLRELIDESVRVRMAADVPLGAFLSGGVDSGSVVASMALQSREPIKTFAIGFEEPEFNELPLAAATARKYGTDHHELVVRPDSVALVSKLVRHFDEPFGDSSAIPTYLVSEFAAQHVKVALTGDGGDELFGGYDSFVEIDRQRWLDLVPRAFKKPVSRLADALPYGAYGKNFLRMISRPSGLDRYFEQRAPHFLFSRLLMPEWMPPADAAWFRRTLPHCLLPGAAEALTEAMYFESTAKLTGDILVKVDRMSMANSLEVRSPLLDHELAEFAARIPHAWKIRNGRGKRVFLDAVGHRLPVEVLSQPKRGFGVPLAAWFRRELRPMLWDYLNSALLTSHGMVSPTFLHVLLEEHDRERRNNHHYLWTLLMLELWLRDFGRYQQAEAAARAA